MADSNTAAREQLSYRVRAGDSFWKIARSHSVSVNDLASWNKLDLNHHLQPGQKLTLFISGS
jgi:membrane-bound lytic murein transglycosylase D